jgi:hypothetical protein
MGDGRPCCECGDTSALTGACSRKRPFDGSFVYASNENRMQQMNERIIKIEAAGLRDAAIAAAKDDRTAAKFETITRDLGDVKVTVGRTEEAVRYLVRTMQEERWRAGQ